MTGEGTITDQVVGAYIAKYATKATGQVLRLNAETVGVFADPDGDHTERLVEAAETSAARTGRCKAPAGDSPARYLGRTMRSPSMCAS